jgi:molecular chaperone DnaK
MVQEAQAHAADDAKRKELVDARNMADQVIYQAEKTMRDLGEKVSGSDRAEAEGQINDLRDAVKAGEINRIKRATETLQQTLMRIGQGAYGQAGQQGGQPNNGNAGGDNKNDDGVVEGEYRAV